MSRQVASVPCAEGATRALEGLLPRVDSDMLLKVSSEGEAFAAVAAGVLGVGGRPVVVQVALEPLLVGQQFEAQRTHPLPRPALWLPRRHRH